MNNSCCQVDSICHMENSGFYSLIENIVNSSVNNLNGHILLFSCYLLFCYYMFFILSIRIENIRFQYPAKYLS